MSECKKCNGKAKDDYLLGKEEVAELKKRIDNDFAPEKADFIKRAVEKIESFLSGHFTTVGKGQAQVLDAIIREEHAKDESTLRAKLKAKVEDWEAYVTRNKGHLSEFLQGLHKATFDCAAELKTILEEK